MKPKLLAEFHKNPLPDRVDMTQVIERFYGKIPKGWRVEITVQGGSLLSGVCNAKIVHRRYKQA